MRRAAAEIRVLARDPLLLALVVAIFVAIVIFVVYPLAWVLVASVQVRGAWTAETYALMVDRRLYRAALANSLSVGVVVGIAGVVIGYLAAFVLTRLDVPGK